MEIHQLKRVPVLINWVDPDSDWHHFWLLGKANGLIYLQGRDEPIAKHDGDCFTVKLEEIRSIKLDKC